jgi:hypothetical protein
MVQVLLYIIPVFIVYKFIRSSWVSNETLKVRYRICRLQDQLYWLAISGEVDANNKEYIRLYRSMDKVLVMLPRLNFWVMLYLLIKAKKEIGANEIEAVYNELEKNSALKEIYEKYHRLLISYIARKNIITVILTIPFWKKIFQRYILPKDSSRQHKQSSVSDDLTRDGFDVEEYVEFVYYFRSASTRSLIFG